MWGTNPFGTLPWGVLGLPSAADAEVVVVDVPGPFRTRGGHDIVVAARTVLTVAPDRVVTATALGRSVTVTIPDRTRLVTPPSRTRTV